MARKLLTLEEMEDIVIKEIDRLKGSHRQSTRKWGEDALLCRRQLIAKWLGQGQSKLTIIQRLMNVWGVSQGCSYEYLNDAKAYIVDVYSGDGQKLAEQMIAKLESIAEDAMANRDRKAALKAYDQISKIQGLYEEKVKVENDVVISFDFGTDN